MPTSTTRAGYAAALEVAAADDEYCVILQHPDRVRSTGTNVPAVSALVPAIRAEYGRGGRLPVHLSRVHHDLDLWVDSHDTEAVAVLDRRIRRAAVLAFAFVGRGHRPGPCSVTATDDGSAVTVRLGTGGRVVLDADDAVALARDLVVAASSALCGTTGPVRQEEEPGRGRRGTRRRTERGRRGTRRRTERG